MGWSEVEAYYKAPVTSWTPTSETTGYEADNMLDGLDVTWWKATSSADQELIFDSGVPLISSFLTSVFDAAATIPTGISYAPDGTLWVCDYSTDKIYNIETDGTLISSFATSVFDAGAAVPTGISYAPDGTLWVCDNSTDKIYNIETDGTLISSFATSVFDAGATQPQGISYAPDGTLWVCDYSTGKIYNIETDGTLISSFATSVFDAGATIPTGISYAPDGTLWFCDYSTDKIYNIETDGTLISSFATSVFDAAATQPQGISYAPDGTLWVCDNLTDKIYNVQPLPVFDYLAIGAGHNLNTIGASVEWYYSDDAAAYTQIGQTISPPDDKSFVIKSDSTLVYRAIKVKITGASAAAQITLCTVGLTTVLGYANLYDPQRRKRNQIINLTQGGRLAGGAIKYYQREIDLKFRNVDNTLYGKIDDLWQDQGIKIFFLAWEPTEHSPEIYPVYIDDTDRNAPFVKSGVLRNDGIKLKGLYE